MFERRLAPAGSCCVYSTVVEAIKPLPPKRPSFIVTLQANSPNQPTGTLDALIRLAKVMHLRRDDLVFGDERGPGWSSCLLA